MKWCLSTSDSFSVPRRRWRGIRGGETCQLRIMKKCISKKLYYLVTNWITKIYRQFTTDSDERWRWNSSSWMMKRWRREPYSVIMIHQRRAEIASAGRLGVGLMTRKIMKCYLANTTLGLSMKITSSLELYASQHIYITINNWLREVRSHNGWYISRSRCDKVKLTDATRAAGWFPLIFMTVRPEQLLLVQHFIIRPAGANN